MSLFGPLCKRIFCNKSCSLNFVRNVSCKNDFKVSNLLLKWTQIFSASNVPEPRESAEEILIHVLGGNKRSVLHRNMDNSLTAQQHSDMGRLCELRLQRLPVQYIIGEWQFRDLTLKMRPPVFIPRPETETLVDVILCNSPFAEAVNNNYLMVLEIGCGSGAIGLALLNATENLKIVAVDRSTSACDLTKENAILNKLDHRIEVFNCDVTKNNDLSTIVNSRLFNCIVSNPPYIPTKDMSCLEPEISLYEDINALHGGESGLNVIIPILKHSSNLLLPRGKIYMEVDTSHPNMIKSWLNQDEAGQKLKYVETFNDLYGKPRIVLIELIGK